MALERVLWQRLLYPGDHPLFRQIKQRTTDFRPQWLMLWVSGLGAALFLTIDGLQLGAFEPFVPVLLLTVLTVCSTSYVIPWSLEISAAIGQAQQHNSYDLFCLTPPGASGANWAICSACMHRYDLLGWIDAFRRAVTALVCIVFLIVLISIALSARNLDMIQIAVLCLDMVIVTIVSYTEHRQSVLLGSLIAMLVPQYMRTRSEGQLWTVICFTAIQAISLLLALLLTTWVDSSLNTLALNEADFYARLSPMPVSLLIFYVSRSFIINVLWKRLLYEWNF